MQAQTQAQTQARPFIATAPAQARPQLMPATYMPLDDDRRQADPHAFA